MAWLAIESRAKVAEIVGTSGKHEERDGVSAGKKSDGDVKQMGGKVQRLPQKGLRKILTCSYINIGFSSINPKFSTPTLLFLFFLNPSDPHLLQSNCYTLIEY